MKNTIIDAAIEQLEKGLEEPIPQNLVYRILVADVAKVSSTWNSIKLAKVIASSKFKPLTKQPKSKKVLSIGMKTPTKMYYYPILNYLSVNNLSANIKYIYGHLEDTQVFTTSDLELVGGVKSEPRWKSTVRWAKHELIEKGFLKRKSLRGTWEMTKSGHRWYVKHISKGI